jgi:hypothetical protein
MTTLPDLRGVLLCWPFNGAPQAFFETDGRGFKVSNLAETDALAEAADDACAELVAWGEHMQGPLPSGWRIALAGDLAAVEGDDVVIEFDQPRGLGVMLGFPDE